jgi:hypothetical protein
MADSVTDATQPGWNHTGYSMCIRTYIDSIFTLDSWFKALVITLGLINSRDIKPRKGVRTKRVS